MSERENEIPRCSWMHWRVNAWHVKMIPRSSLRARAFTRQIEKYFTRCRVARCPRCKIYVREFQSCDRVVSRRRRIKQKKGRRKRNGSSRAAFWYSLSVAGCQRTKHNYVGGWSTSLPASLTACSTRILPNRYLPLFASKLYSYLGDYLDDPSGSGEP